MKKVTQNKPKITFNFKMSFNVIRFVLTGQLLLLLLFHRCVGSNLPCGHISSDSPQYFRQMVDHFNPVDNRTWNQSFQISNKFSKQGGPVFLYIVGEISAPSIDSYHNHQWMKWAEEIGALVVVLEHRYYGSEEDEIKIELHRRIYLTVEQAIADYATIVPHVQKLCQLPVGTKWMAIGPSYGGSLATWLRYKYPHLIYMSVASGAPLRMEFSLTEYEETVLNDIDRFSPGCLDNLKEVVDDILDMMNTDETRLESIFSLCDSTLKGYYTKEYFKYQLHYNIDAAIQVDGERGIHELCGHLNASNDRVEEFSNYLRKNARLLNETDIKCLRLSFNESIQLATNTMWDYQKCTQLGLFKTSKLFQVDTKYYVHKCSMMYDEIFKKSEIQLNINQLNTMNGGTRLPITRAIFTFGELDPWRPYTTDVNSKSQSIVVIRIKGATHAKDFGEIFADDSKELREARQMTFDEINKLLNLN